MANFSASVVRIKNKFFFWGDEFRISRLFDSTLIRSSEAHFYCVICSTDSELVQFHTCSCLEASLPATFHVQSLDALNSSPIGEAYETICEFIDIFLTLGSSKGTSQMLLMKLPMGNFRTTVI
jgi:hypothetical protein